MHASILQSLALVAATLAPLAIAIPMTHSMLLPGSHTASEITVVPSGGRVVHVGKDIHVVAANGTVIHVVATAARKSSKSTKARGLTQTGGWITDAQWLNPSDVPIASFKTSWTVPPAPVGKDDQLLYLFNCLEPGSGDAILQPVLQYGTSRLGGGEFWSVASWYLYDGAGVFTSSLVPVDVGQHLGAEIQLVGTSTGPAYSYTSQFTNIPGTGIIVSGAEEMKWASITLEAYGLTAMDDYPIGSTVFSGTSIDLVNGESPKIAWQIADDAADGISTKVSADGSIEISY
ncbi:hypothetical protein C8R47DRAFT_1244198 [Mycena vitilis]|nr:hypothetical protein C8R47DRAFT_1244198 [Mycena vitilis]